MQVKGDANVRWKEGTETGTLYMWAPSVYGGNAADDAITQAVQEN
jgi:hypothetical protein